MSKGKVVLVPFPFDDWSSSKLRPAICLTDAIGAHRHIILAFITSRIPNDLLPSDLIVNSTDSDFATTGLRVTSTLRLHCLVTVSESLIKRQLGKVTNTMQIAIDDKLTKLFAIADAETS